MSKTKFISPQKAARLIKPGWTVTTGGFGSCGHPEAISAALEDRFEQESVPTGLTLIFSAGQGDKGTQGINRLGKPGLLSRVIGGYWALAPRLKGLIDSNSIEAYNWPQGVVSQLFRSIAAGGPGVISQVGLETFIDPRQGGGRLNTKTKEDIVKLIELGGQKYLHYPAMPINCAVIRGTCADVNGNISMEEEANFPDAFAQACAAHNSGGIVIAQVARISTDPLPAHQVRVPGIVVDYVVESPSEFHWQTYGEKFNPSFLGASKLSDNKERLMTPLNAKKIIARRALLELNSMESAVVNLGIGTPEVIAMVANEERTLGFTLTVESGAIGGYPAGGMSFGATIQELENINGFYNSPYPLSAIAGELNKNASVGVVGSSLSGIDTLLGLKRYGHTGKLVCTSRRGRFPSVRGQNNRRYHPEIITKSNIEYLAESAGGYLTLEDVSHLIIQEIEHADDNLFDLSEVLNNKAGAYEYLQSEITLAQGKERIWQSIIYALNGVIDWIWHYLSDEDKRRFMRDFRSLWLAYRVSFPVQNALKLQELLRTDQLSLLGGLRDVDYDPRTEQFLLELEDRHSGLSVLVRTKYLINATGYSNSVAKCRVPLIQNMVKRGLARPSPYSGFEVDFFNGTVHGQSNWHSDRLYALGALATGAWLHTNIFEVNVRHARQAAQRIIEQLGSMQQLPVITTNHSQAPQANYRM